MAINLAVKVKAEDISPSVVKVSPASVKIQSEGMCFREIVVHLPTGVTAAMLNERTDMFEKVQSDVRTALHTMDRLVIIAADGSWLAEAWVAAATSKTVALSIGRIVKLESKTAGLFSDGKYAVRYNAGSYDVERISDGLVIASGLGSEGIAAQVVRAQYAKKV